MTETKPNPYHVIYVHEINEFRRMLEKLGDVETVFLDLEADSMYHYYAKVCLVQLLAGDTCYLVDTLADIPVPEMLEALTDKKLVVHGGDYDLRMLYQLFGFRPREIFDTMLAAQLLGLNSIGLAALVNHYCGITLDKEHQKANWSRRPLSPEMLAYAAQDTFFLPKLHIEMTAALNLKSRLNWHAESCRMLIENTAKSKEIDKENLWRVEGSFRLLPRQLAVLKNLWEWREATAQRLDLPPYRILPTDLLMRLAQVAPPEGEPEQIPGLPGRLDPEFKRQIMENFQRSLELPASLWPEKLKSVRKPPKIPDSRVLANLKTVRDRIATELQLDPSLLAPKSILIAVAQTGLKSLSQIKSSAGMMQWQEALLLEAWVEMHNTAKSESNPLN